MANEADPVVVNRLMSLITSSLNEAIQAASDVNLLAAIALCQAKGLGFREGLLKQELRFREAIYGDRKPPEERTEVHVFGSVILPLTLVTCGNCRHEFKMIPTGWYSCECRRCGSKVRNPSNG